MLLYNHQNYYNRLDYPNQGALSNQELKGVAIMARNVWCDPLLLVIRQRQDELLREAASWRLAQSAEQRRDARRLVKKNNMQAFEPAIWRKAA
jgi:hypothetical protein